MYELVELEIMNIFSNTSFFPSSPEKAQGQKTKNVFSDVGGLKRKIRDWSFGIPKNGYPSKTKAFRRAL